MGPEKGGEIKKKEGKKSCFTDRCLQSENLICVFIFCSGPQGYVL